MLIQDPFYVYATVDYYSDMIKYDVEQVLDGHNGASAAIYAKENLLSDVMSALSSTLSRDEWLASLPRALVAGFVKTDKDFQEKGVYYYVHL